MTKIKIKLRSSSVEGKAGFLYYYVSHRRVVRHIATGIRILPENWDEALRRVLPGDADSDKKQSRIECDITALHHIVRELESCRHDFTADDIVERFLAPERHISVMMFLHEQIEFFTDCKRLGTAMNYRRAATSLAAFLGGRELCLSDITSLFAERYGDYLLRKGLTRNSLSFHMRILRATYNKAVRCGYVEQTYPFRNVYTGIDRTRKRAVGEDVISRLIHLKLSAKSPLAFARDLFLFSFYTRGMAFVDMAYLRKSDIHDGAIRYARHKTGHELTVRVEPCIKAIIDRYARAVWNTPYVFPILKNSDTADCFRTYKTRLRTYNNRLARLSRLLGLGCNLTSYTSRHSWATMARNHNVPVSVISAGMGHSSERTTQIYLTSFCNSLIDSANKEILGLFSKSRRK